MPPRPRHASASSVRSGNGRPPGPCAEPGRRTPDPGPRVCLVTWLSGGRVAGSPGPLAAGSRGRTCPAAPAGASPSPPGHRHRAGPTRWRTTRPRPSCDRRTGAPTPAAERSPPADGPLAPHLRRHRRPVRRSRPFRSPVRRSAGGWRHPYGARRCPRPRTARPTRARPPPTRDERAYRPARVGIGSAGPVGTETRAACVQAAGPASARRGETQPVPCHWRTADARTRRPGRRRARRGGTQPRSRCHRRTAGSRTGSPAAVGSARRGSAVRGPGGGRGRSAGRRLPGPPGHVRAVPVPRPGPRAPRARR